MFHFTHTHNKNRSLPTRLVIRDAYAVMSCFINIDYVGLTQMHTGAQICSLTHTANIC
jgi:hypothetical protein